MENFKDRLAQALALKGWTAADLSRRSGVGKDLLSRYLHGEVIPKQSKVADMAQALNVSPAWLMCFSVTMDGKAVADLDIHKLTDINRAKLEAYYQALLDSQEANDGDT